MANIFACITSPDGRFNFDVLRAVEAACASLPGSSLQHMTCAHGRAVTCNKAVSIAKAGGFTHLLFVDNNTIIPPHGIESLLKLNARIATGCVPTTTVNASSTSPHLNVAICEDRGKPVWRERWFAGIRETPFCEASCLLVRMDVFERIDFPWFRSVETWDDSGNAYEMRHEDLDFCDRVTAAGMIILADGNVRCGHWREVDVAEFVSDERETWGSHQKVLRRIGRAADIESVVEYGCGFYSTSVFLDRTIFPSVHSVRSFDSDRKWVDLVSDQLVDDRLEIRLCQLKDMPNARCHSDLVMVDCGAYWNGVSTDYSVRSRLFRRYELSKSIVVLHDVEEPQLADAYHASAYKYKVLFRDKIPQTAVASNTFDVVRLQV